MANCSCGAVNHMEQIDLYPIGTKADLRIYGIATVTGHCDDGRAVFDVGEAGHTFHHVDSWVIEVLESPKKYLWTDERIKAECGYYDETTFTMSFEDVQKMRDEYEARIAELTK